MAQRARKADRPKVQKALGAGLHGGHVELEASGKFRVRLCDGRSVTARPEVGVDPALVRECMRARRLVILVDSPRGPRIAGALETQLAAASRSETGVVTLKGRELRLEAEDRVHLAAGGVGLTAEESGKMRLEGDRLVIDMAALVKVLSMKVELP